MFFLGGKGKTTTFRVYCEAGYIWSKLMPNKAKHEDFVTKYFAGQTYQFINSTNRKEVFLKRLARRGLFNS